MIKRALRTRFRNHLIAVSILGGVFASIGAARLIATTTLSDLCDPSLSVAFTHEVKDGGGNLIYSVGTTRNPVYAGGIQSGCALSMTVTVDDARRINRVRLIYKCAGGGILVLDDASESNGRISSAAVAVTVAGTLPITATYLALLLTHDSGSEFVLQSVGT